MDAVFTPYGATTRSWHATCSTRRAEVHIVVGTIILVVLILLLLGALPSWPYSRNWGYAPSGTLGTVLLIVLVLVLLGRI